MTLSPLHATAIRFESYFAAARLFVLLLSCLQHSILVRIVRQFAERAIDFNDDIFESFEMPLAAKNDRSQKLLTVRNIHQVSLALGGLFAYNLF